ncbi:protoheme IX farnesyltransferase [Metarhizium album ARSEF 1941]|uniref:Protoheme IX farnesyltransferase, mitochondrial n=1 Tax=Metarhizium album (strain ARSEF 1941) TaxID=1081103 RepID=A0A0B2WPQ3_METAS|nr:protoheme IX farnesyltransferase [Metarhizium album ARSEF 1941]KHN95462.1 protoheme IX farnesyltransferase [Metarhizium album ARSEF 1941]
MQPPRIVNRTCEVRSIIALGRRQPSRWLSSSSGLRAPRSSVRPSPGPLTAAGFFLSNRTFDRSRCLDSIAPDHWFRKSSTSTCTSARLARTQPTGTFTANIQDTPQLSSCISPHRQRRARKQASVTASAVESAANGALPANASTILTNVAAAQPARSLRRILSVFLSLSKPRLTVLVVLTAMAPYALYPVPEMLTPTMTETPSLSPLTLLFLTTGTALCSASANALNMLYEPATDAKMSRTRNRPLVRKLVSPRTAALFAMLAGAAGVGALYFGVNPTVSFLGLSNIVLYAGIYTPLKAVTAFNTWVGALVGAIPPLMGWAAAAGEAATNDGSWRELLLASDGSSIGGWLLAGLLFAWQFPHFMALSWPIREEYKAAGLRMLAWTNPARNSRVALRYSIAFIPLCLGLCAAGVTEWSFSATSLPVNGWLIHQAVQFWRFEGHKGSARGLFWASVWHLPGVMILALLHKRAMWSRAWKGVFGDDGDGEWEEDELQDMASMTAANVADKAATTTGTR